MGLTELLERAGLYQKQNQEEVSQKIVTQIPLPESLSPIPKPTIHPENFQINQVNPIKENSKIYDLALEKLNTPEWDLYEFIQTIESFGNTDSCYKPTFELGKKFNSNLTKDLLIKQCEQYLTTITSTSRQKVEEFSEVYKQKCAELEKLKSEVEELNTKISERVGGLSFFETKMNTLKQKIQNLL